MTADDFFSGEGYELLVASYEFTNRSLVGHDPPIDVAFPTIFVNGEFAYQGWSNGDEQELLDDVCAAYGGELPEACGSPPPPPAKTGPDACTAGERGGGAVHGRPGW